MLLPTYTVRVTEMDKDLTICASDAQDAAEVVIRCKDEVALFKNGLKDDALVMVTTSDNEVSYYMVSRRIQCDYDIRKVMEELKND